ncbi:MAG: AraC family transcriptional regulator [Dorea sp.]|jgi:AraC-like DNA-binding protein|nr:AraC family transcriptional regulator [Dorea sp.]
MEQSTHHVMKPLAVYFYGREKCAPRHSYGPGIRPHYLIHAVIRGNGIFRQNGREYPLAAGDAFLIRPLETTYYEADPTEPWEYMWIGFDGTEVKSILSETYFDTSPVCYIKDTKWMTEIYEQISARMREYYTQTSRNALTACGLLLELLGAMGSHPVKNQKNLTQIYLEMAREYMKNNYSYDIHISEIATFIGIDRTYLYRIFMEQEQMSPKEYLQQLRIRAAGNMLRSTEHSVTEIAYSCGFKDASAFCNHFRKLTGMTPKVFRRFSALEESDVNI